MKITKEQIKQKARNAKLEMEIWVKEQQLKARRFWVNHKTEIIVLAPIVIPAISNVAIKAINGYNKRKEQERKDLTIWDPSAQHKWPLRRKLTTSEWLEVSERRAKNEKLGDILESMKVLY